VKLSDLILAIGDDNVKVQNLFDSIGSAQQTKKGGTKISFYTDAVNCTELMDVNTSKNIGLVVWLPREKVEAAVAAEKNTAPEMTYEEALEAVKGMTLNDLSTMLDGPDADHERLAEVNKACGVLLDHIDKGKRA
jgi:hypothetical protein